MVSHTEFQIAKNICHLTFLQCVGIKPHLCSLTNVENSTNKFRQSVQFYCKEQREENNGNCKAFCITRKRKKSRFPRKTCFVIEKKVL